MNSSSHELNQANFDIDLLSDFQVTDDVSSGVPAHEDAEAIHGGSGVHGLSNMNNNNAGLLDSDGQNITMILEDDGQSFHTQDASSNELVLESFGSDHIVFGNVSNEVSIQAGLEKPSQSNQQQHQVQPPPRQNILPSKSITVKRPPQRPTIGNIASGPRLPTQQPILIPVGTSNQPSGLAQFISSIRPPAIPGASNIKPRVMPITTTTVQAIASRKPVTIAPAPSSGKVTKVLMTQTGQQLLISRPIKSEAGTNVGTRFINASAGTITVTSSGQQIVFLSPVKGHTVAGGQKFVQVLPKPAIAPAPIRIASTTSSPSSSSNVKPVQVIRLVTVSSSSASTSSGQSTMTVAGSNKGNLRPIAPNTTKAQTITPISIANAIGSGQKIILPAETNLKPAQEDANRQRKPCNCTKSQCLKLYCDCFANGEFCNSCNCTNCSNNLDHEEERQKAIKQCLERNPHAFHPKIGKGRGSGDVAERRHTKGCNCRRSGCLKNYCECYEAKILCTELCKCCGCKNYEDSFERKTLMHLADAAEVRSAQQIAATKAKWWGSDFVPKLPIPASGDR